MFKLSLSNNFLQHFVDLLDQHQEGYDEANSTTYGAATSLRENGELDFNFREYDNKVPEFSTFLRNRVLYIGIKVSFYSHKNKTKVENSC